MVKDIWTEKHVMWNIMEENYVYINIKMCENVKRGLAWLGPSVHLQRKAADLEKKRPTSGGQNIKEILCRALPETGELGQPRPE